MRKLIILAFFLFAANFVFAAEVGLDEAKSFAKGWRGRNVSAARTHKSAAGENRFHVVSFEGGGWAAVGVDDEEAPVIAFSDEGTELVEDEKNPVWFLVKRDAERRAKGREISHKEHKGHRGKHKGWEKKRRGEGEGEGRSGVKLEAGEAKTATIKTAVNEGALEDVRVEPILKSTWNQTTANNYSNGPLCYNYYTPNNYYCGCVATAVAQIMRYHEWPQKTIPATNRRCWVNGVANDDLWTKGKPYDWSIMTLKPDGSTPDDNRREIGKLCYDVGVMHNMQYSSTGSGTYTGLAKRVLVDDFGYKYARYIAYHDEDCSQYDGYNPFDYNQFKTVIVTNCDAGKPVLLGIGKSNSNSGHAVVADGYGYARDSFYVHINGGWGGASNAWYAPPDEIFAGGYNVIDEVVYNIFPETEGAIVSGRVLDHNGEPISGATVDFYSVILGTTNMLGSATTNQKGIYAWIRGKATGITCNVRASHPDIVGDKTIESSRKITIKEAGSFEPNEVLDNGGCYLSWKPYGFNLGNQDGVDFTLDLRRFVPKVLFR